MEKLKQLLDEKIYYNVTVKNNMLDAARFAVETGKLFTRPSNLFLRECYIERIRTYPYRIEYFSNISEIIAYCVKELESDEKMSEI